MIEFKSFCCGQCGQPTDLDGDPLVEIPPEFNQEEAELVQGLCCLYQTECLQEWRVITKEMASDAGMPEIEGMLY